MKTQTQIKIDLPKPVTVELSAEIVKVILTKYLNQRFHADLSLVDDLNDLAEQIVQAHLARSTERLDRQTKEPTSKDPLEVAKPWKKSRNNPKPRGDRLTGTYLGKGLVIEPTQPTITAKLRNTIETVLAMTDSERAKHYSGALRLHSYSHAAYKWFATLRTSVIGTPVRRFFTDLQGAVTWLEIVRERCQNQNLVAKIPQGGVSRDAFQMTWQSQTSGAVRGQHGETLGVPKAPNGINSSSSWTAERRAQFSATIRSKTAYHSINPLKQEARVRPCATTAEILAGAYMPPMPGNNLKTAIENGSTAAIATTPSSDPS